MRSIFINTWALFFGFSILCLGHGLQGTLIGVRAVLENFSYFEIGFVMSGYYIGFLLGSILIPILLNRVGHIRVFAALASLASIAILLHSLFINPSYWFIIRILTGISLAGIFVIMESWLNDKSSNKTRGKILATYMIVTFLFLGLGQFLLNLSNPIKVDLFILISILLSLSLIPILLSVSQAPIFNNPKRISFKELYVITPLGFVGALIIGLSHGTVFGYGAVYAAAKGLSTFNISLFMVTITIFGALFQWPIGFISDKIDRRIILIAITLVASGLSIIIVISSYLSLFLFFIVIALFAGMCLPMYSLVVAHTNDFLQPEEIVAASASISILVSIGLIMGPISVSLFMNLFGADGFFVHLFIVHLFLGLFGLYRMSQRTKSEDLESQYTALPRNITPAGMQMNPKTEYEES
tara:strand:- start:1917 stop:3152 length:1236 start_codon:yes stop_codon:yes gene_type:complete